MAKKLNVAYDADGSIVSATESKHIPMPKHGKGLSTGEFDVPDKFENKKPREYLHSLKVDVKARQLTEKQ
ncbi:hypothetical protein P3T23_003550 [Paraburkholderia sp. GAS448]|uniref:hypothetical protein n=1 Tax=Paraburkholderia sp. GAS448 TaxID=3035136 RepID=UPI003D260BBD